jgi:GNAT superfamily N-acetyltransferase
LSLDAPALEASFRAWLTDKMPAGIYRAWLMEADDGAIAAGGGISILPWPPGPSYMGDTIAIVYNLYTEPAHRRRGLARRLDDHHPRVGRRARHHVGRSECEP